MKKPRPKFIELWLRNNRTLYIVIRSADKVFYADYDDGTFLSTDSCILRPSFVNLEKFNRNHKHFSSKSYGEFHYLGSL